jgi:S-formylglutathione hydrolase FrmB
MDRCSVNFFSDSLSKYSSLDVYLPRRRGAARRRRDLPVLYLLHGYSDDYSAWGRFSRLEKYVQQHEVAVVTPDGSTSFYVNSPLGRYEDHIIQDVIGFAEASFPVGGARERRAIAGLSMGGYGALSLALKHPRLFAAVSAHSAAVYPAPRVAEHMKNPIVAAALDEPGNDLDRLARALAAARRRPALRFDCGRDDFLYQDNLKFRDALQGIGLAHEFHSFDGAHTWDYWEEHIDETFQFVKRYFKK